MENQDKIVFADVLDAMDRGYVVYRKAWTIGSYIFRQIESSILVEHIDSIATLPDTVKSLVTSRYNQDMNNTTVKFVNGIAIIDRYNNISRWTPKDEDLYADDWEVLLDY